MPLSLQASMSSESDEVDAEEAVAVREAIEEKTKSISIAVKQGQRRRIMKGMVYQTEEKHGYIYLVRTREFKSLRRPIYKVGKTSQCPDTRITRLHKYTKGSEIYLILQCDVLDVSLIETDILGRFCHRWDPGPDGSEDFIIPTEADLLDAKDIIYEVVRNYAKKRIGGERRQIESGE